jgi:hypothetical protein
MRFDYVDKPQIRQRNSKGTFIKTKVNSPIPYFPYAELVKNFKDIMILF